MRVSETTKQRLIRYATAVQQYETRLSGATIDEHSAAKNDLKNCPESEIQALVHQIWIERIDEAMPDESKTPLDVIQADHDAVLAKNELVALGHKFKAEQTIQPSSRGKVNGRRRNRRTRTIN
jgi:hypothetical protein